jgi:hypothetical protein
MCCRNTAKKFLAAANFLELLKIFDPLSQDVIIHNHPTINCLYSSRSRKKLGILNGKQPIYPKLSEKVETLNRALLAAKMQHYLPFLRHLHHYRL